MSSPFPGMDPFLERHWLDVQTKLVAYAADTLNRDLPPDLIARDEERIATGPEGEPLPPAAQVEPLTERFVTIFDASTEKLITVIEFLSPSNKRRGEGLRDYVGKRKALLAADVSVVEVDLNRSGDWQALLLPYIPPVRHTSAYRVTIHRADRPGQVQLFPIPLAARLPAIPVPLRPGDANLPLDLQPLIDQAYLNGRYARTLDYRAPCAPPLDADDDRWANDLLKSAGRR